MKWKHNPFICKRQVINCARYQVIAGCNDISNDKIADRNFANADSIISMMKLMSNNFSIQVKIYIHVSEVIQAHISIYRLNHRGAPYAALEKDENLPAKSHEVQHAFNFQKLVTKKKEERLTFMRRLSPIWGFVWHAITAWAE